MVIAMNKKIFLDRIIKYFLGDSEIPAELDDMKRLWEDLVKSNDIKEVPENILSDEDKFLRLELINRKLTDGEKVATIDKTLGSLIKYSDKIALWNGDITTIYADSIVNPTTISMLRREDVDSNNIGYDVFLRSGMRLGLKCMSLVNDEELSLSDILITRAYNLPCDYIIHVIISNFSFELSQEEEKIISMSYRNILECAKNNTAKTIVIPCIGIDSCKNVQKLALVAIKTVVKFLEENDKVFDKVIFQVGNDDMYNEYSKCLLGDSDA